MSNNKWEITPVFVGFLLLVIGVLMNIFNWYPTFGKSSISFGVCIIFAILASNSGKEDQSSFSIFLILVAVASFVAFVIFLWLGINALPNK